MSYTVDIFDQFTFEDLRDGTFVLKHQSGTQYVFDKNGEIKSPSINAGSVSNDDYHETVVSGSVTGTTGLDLSAANFFSHTLTGNTTFTFDNAESTPAGNSFTLIVQQDATGGHSITWPTSVEWDSGSAPSLSTAANDKHMIGFISPDGGTTWIGVVSATGIA